MAKFRHGRITERGTMLLAHMDMKTANICGQFRQLFLRSKVIVHDDFERLQGRCACAKNKVVEFFEGEFIAEGSAGFRAQVQKFQFPNLV